MSRRSMRYVAVKTVEQQDIQAVHRVRAGLISERTAKANQLRGLVYEYGLVAPRQIASLRRAVPAWLEDATNGLSVRFRALLAGLYRDLQYLDERVRELDREIAALARENEAVRRIEQLRGIGPLTASALVAMVGDGRQFKNGRHLAVALGLTPRQHSSGGKEKLLGISKRGDKSLGDGVSGTLPPQRRGHRTRAQDGAGCLGDAQKRNELRTGAHRGLNAVRPD
jgi:transposase